MSTPTVYTPKRLALPQQLPAATGTLYTSPAAPGLGTQLTSAVVVNTTAASVVVTIYVVESGGTAADNRALCKAFSVPADGLPYELVPAGSQIFLNASDTLQGIAGAATSVTLHLSGVELA